MTIPTDRLDLRPTEARDRERFVSLFGDEEFMAFSGGTLDLEAANRRFDSMLALSSEIGIAKQPIIERSSNTIIGYMGVDRFEFEGEQRLEFGYRLVPAARGNGYATEAGRALLATASSDLGELLAMIDPRNAPSQNVATKLGFEFWKEAMVDGYLDGIWRLSVG